MNNDIHNININNKSNNGEIGQIDGIIGSHSSNNSGKIPLLHFNDRFNSHSIQNIIRGIENIRVNGTHKKVTIYFRSPGGILNDMWTLIDYIERLEGLDVTFIVDGYICSAGFWSILLVSTLPHVDIKLGYGAAAMIHLADVSLSVRDEYSDNPNHTKFVKERITRVNNDFMHVVYNMGLTEEQIKAIRSGQDVYLHRDQLVDTLREYYDWWDIDSGTLVNNYQDVLHRIEHLKEKKKMYETTYLRSTGKKITDVINPPSKKKLNKKEVK